MTGTSPGTPSETEEEKHDVKAGRIPEDWTDKPAKLAQKNRDARWTVKWSKAKPAQDGSARVDIAVPAFGYRKHLGIDRRHRLIRTIAVTDAARHDGTLLPVLIEVRSATFLNCRTKLEQPCC